MRQRRARHGRERPAEHSLAAAQAQFLVPLSSATATVALIAFQTQPRLLERVEAVKLHRLGRRDAHDVEQIPAEQPGRALRANDPP
eukprot:31497-Pelagococcus_subviridis.AAC.68